MNDGPLTDYVVWSDGSCLGNPGPGGYAAVVLHRATGLEHAVVTGSDDGTTNQRMELTAAAMGLSRVPKGLSATVYTDSKYVVDGISGWIHGWMARGWKKADGSPVANVDEWKRLHEQCKGRFVQWVHVRGHRGVEMNEKVDKLAQAAAKAAASDA
ncbi:ribonuclease HI [Sinorhizobium meliloti]|nr:ribonuclease HI [Sinorhizobium meliloti]